MWKSNNGILALAIAVVVLITHANDSFAFRINRSVKKYHDSCNNGAGNINDCASLGDLYYEGAKVRQNYQQAFKFSKIACDKNVANGCYILGQLYSFGDFVEVNKKIAFEYFNSACNVGNHGAACLELALIHYKRGNKLKSTFYAEKACDGGTADGCTLAGSHHSSAIKKSKNIKLDFVKSFNLYGKACDLDDVAGCMLYARMFVYGMGVEASKENAKKYYAKACDLEVQFWKRRRTACKAYDALEKRFSHLKIWSKSKEHGK